MTQSHFRACKACGTPIEEHYVGVATYCKPCWRERVKARRRNNPAVQEYDRKRAKKPERAQKIRAIAKRWRAENTDGYKAHATLGYAVRTGKIAKEPCYFCGKASAHAHHQDYSRPLNVTWLCAKCHHRLHALVGS